MPDVDPPPPPEATPEELKALAHPLRLRILRLCLHEAKTNKQLADHLGRDPATVLHHVRLLARTGFLAAEPARTGRRGALEKPYRATRKSWSLHVERPEDKHAQVLAMTDALRAELVDAGDEGVVAGARLGLKLSPTRAAALKERIDALISEQADQGDDDDGDEFGLFAILHRRA